MVGSAPARRRLGPDAHVALVCVLLGVTALAVLATYARLPASETYRISGTGPRAGLGRTLVFLNFPVAFAAIPSLWQSTDRLRRSGRIAAGRSRAALAATTTVATALCLLPVLPGVVDPADLDARPVNLLPAAGVLLALGLCVAAARHGERGVVTPRPAIDRLAVLLVGALSIVSLPWVLAELGVYVDDVPALGRVFVGSTVPAGETEPAVHLGHHHGLDGLLLVVTALLLGRAARAASPGLLAGAVRVFLAVMVAFGLFNVVHDGWNEQLAKPGRVDARVPDVLGPELSGVEGILVLGTVAAWLILFRPCPSERAALGELPTTAAA